MLMADGGGSGRYIKAAGDAALKAGKSSEDIAFDAEGLDRVIQRLEDVIYRQTLHQRVSTRVSERSREGADAEDYASSSYASSVNRFDDNYAKWNSEYVKRLEETVVKFKKVKEAYLARDDEIGEQFRAGSRMSE